MLWHVFSFLLRNLFKKQIPTNILSYWRSPPPLFCPPTSSIFLDTAQTQSDSELFVCPWNASVIVKAYHNLGAWNARQREARGSQTGAKKRGFNKTLSGVT